MRSVDLPQKTRPAIVSGDAELVVAQMSHDPELVTADRAHAVWLVIGGTGRLAAVAVATQIGGADGVVLGEVGATRCHITCVSGIPCSSSRGGPLPPRTPWIDAPAVEMSNSSNRSNMASNPLETQGPSCPVATGGQS